MYQLNVLWMQAEEEIFGNLLTYNIATTIFGQRRQTDIINQGFSIVKLKLKNKDVNFDNSEFK